MRRLALAVFIAALVMAAAPGVAAPAGGDRSVVLRGVWKVAGGAAAEARFLVACHPDDSFAFLSIGLRQGGVNVASGTIAGVPCTGEEERLVVALQDPTGADPRPVVNGDVIVCSNLWNCVDGRDPCFEMEIETPAMVVGRPFIRPFDEDFRADLDLVRQRLLADGRVRVVYDLTCAGTGSAPGPVMSTITQVTPTGRLVYGAGRRPTSGGDVDCGPAPTRFRYVVTPDSGRFRAGTSFIDTDFGSRYDWSVFADDQHPLDLTR